MISPVPNPFPSAVSRLLRAYGEQITLRRSNAAAGVNAWDIGAATPTYFSGYGSNRGYKASEIRGGIHEHDRLVTIDTSTFPVIPANGDWLALGVWAQDNQTGYFDWVFSGSPYRWSVGGSAFQYVNALPAEIEWWQIVNVYAPRAQGITAAYKAQVRR